MTEMVLLLYALLIGTVAVVGVAAWYLAYDAWLSRRVAKTARILQAYQHIDAAQIFLPLLAVMARDVRVDSLVCELKGGRYQVRVRLAWWTVVAYPWLRRLIRIKIQTYLAETARLLGAQDDTVGVSTGYAHGDD